MLKIDDTALVVIDVQGKLATMVHQSNEVIQNIQTLIKGTQLLEIPVIWLEQYPKGLGRTTEELQRHISDNPIEKVTFSACQTDEFQTKLQQINKKSLLVTGIEAHICVYQTVHELLSGGHEVELVVDCISSRTHANKNVGMEKMTSLGAKVTSVEMALFELMRTAKHPKFKEISKLIK